jgi:hypothetical protein
VVYAFHLHGTAQQYHEAPLFFTGGSHSADNHGYQSIICDRGVQQGGALRT